MRALAVMSDKHFHCENTSAKRTYLLFKYREKNLISCFEYPLVYFLRATVINDLKGLQTTDLKCVLPIQQY